MSTAQETYNKAMYSLLVRIQNAIRTGIYDGKPQVEQTCASFGGAYKSEFVAGGNRVEILISLHTLPVNKFTLQATIRPKGTGAVRLRIEFERYDSENSKTNCIELVYLDEVVKFDSKLLGAQYFTDEYLDIEDIYTEMYELYEVQLAAVNEREQAKEDRQKLAVVKLIDKIKF